MQETYFKNNEGDNCCGKIMSQGHKFFHQVTASKQQDFAAPPSKEEWGGDQQVSERDCYNALQCEVCKFNFNGCMVFALQIMSQGSYF